MLSINSLIILINLIGKSINQKEIQECLEFSKTLLKEEESNLANNFFDLFLAIFFVNPKLPIFQKIAEDVIEFARSSSFHPNFFPKLCEVFKLMESSSLIQVQSTMEKLMESPKKQCVNSIALCLSYFFSLLKSQSQQQTFLEKWLNFVNLFFLFLFLQERK